MYVRLGPEVELRLNGGRDLSVQSWIFIVFFGTFNVSDFLMKNLPKNVSFLTCLNNRERRGTQQNPEGYRNYDFVENYDLG